MPAYAIDVTTGMLTILQPALVIGPGLTQEAFRASPLGAASEELTRNPPWLLFGFRHAEAGGERFAGHCCFHGEQVEFVTLTVERPEFGSSWAEFSKEKEKARQEHHNTWLLTQLHDHPATHTLWLDTPTWEWAFPWGRVYSGWDVKNGTTEIVIRYRRDGQLIEQG